MRRLHLALLVMAGVCACLFVEGTIQAQVLAGPWVQASQERIDKLRKTDLRVMVLDAAGVPVEAASVRAIQRRHAFAWGATITAPEKTPLEKAQDDQDEALLPPMDQPVWRCFSALSLEAISPWAQVQAERGQPQMAHLRKVVDAALQRNLQLRWGGIVSTDVARLPQWAAAGHASELRSAMTEHIRRMTDDFGRDIAQFEPLTQTLDQSPMLERLGVATIRNMYQQAQSRATDAMIGVRIDDAFTGERLRQAVQHVAAWREAFVPIDYIALEVRVGGTLVEAPLTRGIDWIGELGLPVVIVGLQVTGPSDVAAAINLETALRAFYSHPSVTGIYFAEITAPPLSDPLAALLDAEGQPTPAGKVVEGLLHELWWTDTSIPTDDLGNARLRVFAGFYDLEATLPDGSKATTQVWLPRSSDEATIVMQVESSQ